MPCRVRCRRRVALASGPAPWTPTMSIARLFSAALTAAALLLSPLGNEAQAQAYEAHLPADLATNPDLCALVPCAEVFPGAQSFSQRLGVNFT